MVSHKKSIMTIFGHEQKVRDAVTFDFHEKISTSFNDGSYFELKLFPKKIIWKKMAEVL